MTNEFSSLMGARLVNIQGMEKGSAQVDLVTSDGRRVHLFHEQDCCENVYLEDVVGDPADLMDSPITMAEVVYNVDHPLTLAPGEYMPESYSWTFYKLATVKGYVTLRWYGESNGYYSEGVTCAIVGGPDA